MTLKNTYTIPVITGDGIGPEVWEATELLVKTALKTCYGNTKTLNWIPVLAGKTAFEKTGSWLPDETIAAIKEHTIAIKGPLETPVGKGIRSINVQLRKTFDLYACVRPITWFRGVPSPVKSPEDVDITVFRENTEDIYTGIEWPMESDENKALIRYLQTELNVNNIRFPNTSALSIKPISQEGSERIVESAFHYAKKHARKVITLVHKGNIMKYTEGSFRDWSYSFLEDKYADDVFTMQQYREIVAEQGASKADSALLAAQHAGRIVVNDCIADAFFQNVLLDPTQFSVVVTTNLNGDYISDALAAQVGGIGISPGANINYSTGYAIFEATHGTAPGIVGQNKANPSALLLSACLMLDYIKWHEAASCIRNALQLCFDQGHYTADFSVPGVTPVSTSEFCSAVKKTIGTL